MNPLPAHSETLQVLAEHLIEKYPRLVFTDTGELGQPSYDFHTPARLGNDRFSSSVTLFHILVRDAAVRVGYGPMVEYLGQGVFDDSVIGWIDLNDPTSITALEALVLKRLAEYDPHGILW